MTWGSRSRALGFLAFTVAALLASAAPWARGAAHVLWQQRFGQPGTEEFPSTDAIAAGKGAVFVSGSAANANGDWDFLVLAYDATNGSLMWEDRFDTPGRLDVAVGVAEADGRVFAMGGTNVGNGFPLIRAYDGQTGLLLWHNRLADTRGVFDSAVFHKKSIIAVGGNNTWLVESYEAATGALLWRNRFGVAGAANRATDVAEHAGAVFVGGRAQPEGMALNWFVRAYDAKSGKVIWEDHTAAGEFAQVQSVAADGNRLVAVGRVTNSMPEAPYSDTDWLIRTYDAKTGRLLWQEQLDTGGIDFIASPFDVAVLGGRAFVTGTGGPGCSGFVEGAPDNCDFIVRAYGLDTGRLLWEDRLDRAPIDQGTSIVANDEAVFAIGNGGNNCAAVTVTNCDILIRAYHPKTGRILWEDQADTEATDDLGMGIVAHRGSVFVLGGLVQSDFTGDVLIRAYDALTGRRPRH